MPDKSSAHMQDITQVRGKHLQHPVYKFILGDINEHGNA